MIEENECIVCRRIKPKIVFKYLHQVFDDLVIKKDIIHIMGIEIIEIINIVDREHRFFFCGLGKKTILSGIFYIIGKKYGSNITQRKITEGFNYEITEVTVRNSYKSWCKVIKKINYNINKKGIWKFNL